MASIKRILVAGGAGFLGSHLCERLVEQGHDVICLDNFFTSQKTNVTHLLDQANFELIRHDVVAPILLEVDEIYNLACPAAPGHYQYNPIKTMKTSVQGSINLLGMAKRCNAKIFQASTSEVYGDPCLLYTSDAADDLESQFSQFLNRVLALIPHVDRAGDLVRSGHHPNKRLDQIIAVAEGTSL